MTEEFFRTIIATVGGSAVLAAVINLVSKSREQTRQNIAEAMNAVRERVEMPYRIRRRAPDGSEDKIVRDEVHENQIKCGYYQDLLTSKCWWYGKCYARYVKAVQRLTAEQMTEAWKKKGNPSVEMKKEPGILLDHCKIDSLSENFARDTKAYLNYGRRFLRQFFSFVCEKMKNGAYDVS